MVPFDSSSSLYKVLIQSSFCRSGDNISSPFALSFVVYIHHHMGKWQKMTEAECITEQELLIEFWCNFVFEELSLNSWNLFERCQKLRHSIKEIKDKTAKLLVQLFYFT